jgi:hypothetical protein
MKVGNDIYSILKKNNTAVWAVTTLCIIITSISLLMIFKIYKESQQNMYAINDKGELVPLRKLDEKKDKLKQIQANLDYFVSLYYDLDGYTMKDKKEKILWLVGKQPTTIIKDRDKKGYFNTFLSITGLTQHAKIDQSSWKFGSYDAPYTVSFIVDIVRINGEAKEYYKCEVIATLANCNRNYPYNPYGLIITNLSESLTKIQKYDEYEAEQKDQLNNNQNN